MEPLHDRMPVILQKGDFDFWLDPEFQDRGKLESVCVPIESQVLQTYPVSTLVNKAGNDYPECIDRFEPEPGVW